MYIKQSSETFLLPGNIIGGRFTSMFRKHASLCRDFFRKYNFSEDVLDKLNTTLGGDGIFMYAPEGTKPPRAITIANRINGTDVLMLQSVNLIMLEAGSDAAIIIEDETVSGECVCNNLTIIALGEGARFEFLRQQNINSVTRFSTDIVALQAADSLMKMHYVTVGGNIHNRLRVTLNGKNAEHRANGVSYMKKNEHIDNDVQIVHASPNCKSNQLFKNIISDSATGAFNGRIVVNRDAQETTAYQRCNNILLSPKAKMHIRPHLEILADNVKCSHGATVGQLDEEALFYLRSRGISEAGARALLVKAFTREVFNEITCEPEKQR